MASCNYCRESEREIIFQCNYCGGSYCKWHRIPEAHECKNLSKAEPPTSASNNYEVGVDELKRQAEKDETPYSVLEIDRTVGTTPDPDFDSSPGVASDGSIAGEKETVELNKPKREPISGNQTILLLIIILLLLIGIGVAIF